jgi:hypothetical protein
MIIVTVMFYPLDGQSVIAVSPTQNALHVSLDSPIIVTFDQDMNPATINANTIAVRGNLTGLVVAAYTTTGTTTTITPDGPFMVGEKITVTVTTGIKTTLDSALSSPYSWEFTAEVLGGLISFGTPTKFSTGVGFGLNPATAADLDGDGDIDIAATYEFDRYISVLMNDGYGNYASPISIDPGAVNADFIVTAELNGDDYIDIAVANQMNESLSVLINSGLGSFAPPIHYPTGGGPQAIIAFDMDGDGDNDLATANWDSDSVTVLINNGSAGFDSVMSYGAGNAPISMTAADLDGDGDPDLAVANGSSDSISVILNHGDGIFDSTTAVYPAGDFPYFITSADLDGDGDVDLATANYNSGNVSILMNDGTAIFSAPVNYTVGSEPVHIAASDLDGDGDADLAVTNYGSPSVVVLQNNGSGGFATGASYVQNDFLYSTNAADLDWDGDLDLAVVRYTYGEIAVLLNDWQNTPPVALNDTISTEEDESALLKVALNDTDPESRPVAITEALDTLHASVTIKSDSTLMYVPDPDFWGVDSFRYVITDGYRGYDTASAYITVINVNDPPSEFALLIPTLQDTVDGNLDTLAFSWREAVDIDSPELSYELIITGLGVDTLIATNDTMLVLRDVSIFAHDQIYTWVVNVSDGEYTAACIAAYEFVWSETFGLGSFTTLPELYMLHQNHPNPFNPVSTIRYDLPQSSEVSLVIYDLLGREVARLVDSQMEPGYHQVQWDGRNRYSKEVPSGIYIARLMTPEYSKAIKMALLK